MNKLIFSQMMTETESEKFAGCDMPSNTGHIAAMMQTSSCHIDVMP